MKISRADDGRTIIKLDTWAEIGLCIILPKPAERIMKDDFNLQKVPIEIGLEVDSATGENEGVFSAEIEPEYCEHGVLENIAVELINDDGTSGVRFIHLFTSDGDHDDDRDDGGDGEAPDPEE